MKWLACILVGSAAASAQPPAAEILAKVEQTYLHLHAIHVVAARMETLSGRGAVASTEAAYEFASKPPGRYRAWVRSGDSEGLAVSDGSTTWKALPHAKQWMQQEVASVSDDDEEETASVPSAQPVDMRDAVSRHLFSRYIALARLAEDPQVVKEDAYKLGGTKVACYVLHERVQNFEYDLWIDKDRYLVVRDTQSAAVAIKGGLGRGTIETRVNKLETDEQVSESLFQWAPGGKWNEVDMLELPLERRVQLKGLAAADFQLKSLDGNAVRLSDLRGSVVVLDFWATWCGPCRKEMPIIEKLRAEFAGKAQFFGVNDESVRGVAAFQKQHGYEMPVLMDGKREVHRQYFVHAIPTLVVIDAAGIVRQHYVGSRSEDDLRQAIVAALQ